MRALVQVLTWSWALVLGSQQAFAAPSAANTEPSASQPREVGAREASTTRPAEDQEPPASEETAPSGPLAVGYAGSPPFIVPDRGQPSGLSIDVWVELARRLRRDYDLVEQDSIEQALEKVETGELDAVIGPISITAERARVVSFTQPYYRSSLAIASSPNGGLWGRVRPFLSTAFVSGLGLLLLVLGIVGALMWLVERKVNDEEFPPHPLIGIGNGIWFALVTMTTVGYGDRAPKTVAGRFIAGAWMLVALISVSSLTAGIATALTLSQLGPTTITEARELASRSVAVVEETTSVDFVRGHGATPLLAKDLAQAVALAERGEAAAVVFDRPALLHYLSQHPEVDLQVSPRRYQERGYGFAVRHGSPLQKPLDVALLEMREAGIVPLDLGGEE